MPEPRFLKTIFTYPWDLADEGLDRALDVIQDEGRLNGVSLTAAYHISTYFLPHNPRRKIYYGEEPVNEEWLRTAFESRLQHYLSARVETASGLYEEVVKLVKSHCAC